MKNKNLIWVLIFISVPCFFQFATASHAQGQNVPKGRLVEFEYNKSKIYPGTTRKVTVYIPEQLNPEVPACVFVCHDGNSSRALAMSEMMDQLIASGEMPVTVGVFVPSGDMVYPLDTASVRKNRGYEYNSLGDDYARFLIEEILPFVATKYELNLSDDGNDRCIAGCSSGGICAFNVAWERPDAFKRVYSSCGSYVPYTGGNIIPVLIRKCEPKPIRVFLHGAKHDLNNAGGNFWLVYQRMKDALDYAGYDYDTEETDDKHCQSHVALFPDAMRWLWQDYPQPVKLAKGSPYLNDFLNPEEKWEAVEHHFNSIKCLTSNSIDEVFICDSTANCIYKIGTDNKISLFSSDSRQISDLSVSPDGALYGISELTGKIWLFNADGKSSIIAKKVPGSKIKAISGNRFYAIGKEKGEGKVWLIAQNGDISIVDSGLKNPGACAVVDNKLLLVADADSHWVYSYMIGTDYSLQYKEHSIWLHVPDYADDSGANSIDIDSNGRVFIATRMGIWVGSDQPYAGQAIISKPFNEVTDFCLCGNKMFVTDGTKIFERKLKSK